jgi:hypothetical protein
VLLTKLISFCAESTLEVSLWSKPQEYYAPFFYVLKKRQINQQNGLFTALFQSAIGLLFENLTLCIRLISDVPLAQIKQTTQIRILSKFEKKNFFLFFLIPMTLFLFVLRLCKWEANLRYKFVKKTKSPKVKYS